MHKPRAEPRISPRNRKISRLFSEQPAEDRDPIALRDLPGAAVRTVVGARPAGDPTIVVMAILGHIGGAGAIVGGKPELLEVREAASVGGLFYFGVRCRRDVCFWHIADNPTAPAFVRFSNRPVGVKHFQTIHRCSVDVARGLVLLFGIGTKALPSWDSRTRRNNLLGGLAVRRTAGPSGQTNSPHPSSREGHHSTARWSSGFLLSHLILHRSHAAALLPGSSGTRCRQPICGA